MSRPTDLVQGTLGLILLKLLALQPMHGWAIIQHLRDASDGELQVSDASLYEALHRLEQDGWIKGAWKQTPNNRRAKFYSLTPDGRRQLAKETGEWNRLAGAIGRLMRLRALDA